MTIEDITKEIIATVNAHIEKGEAVPISQIVEEIIAAHPIEGADAEWLKEIARQAIYEIINEALEPKPENAQQHAEELRQYAKQREKTERIKNSGLRSV